ncbi:MAG TPA: response regulator [Chitinivibrionales bacterium]|nr:response regulator [Chitinivibrionales bacterium]
MAGASILIIDDELAIRRLLRLTLSANGYGIIEAPTGKDGIYQAASGRPDAVILDLGLPDMDGRQVLSKIREWSTVPIIILSVRAEENEKVAALEAGADDYVTKPFGTGELIARLAACLRRSSRGKAEIREFRNGNLYVDLVKRIVKNGDAEVKLTATEYTLLLQFIKNAGMVLTHRHLMKELWGPYRSEETQNLRVHMAQLRKKLEIDPASPELFVTESGVGYRMPLLDVLNRRT